MFYDKYKRDNEKIKTDAAQLERLQHALQQTPRLKRKNVWPRVVAAGVACLLLVVTGLALWPALGAPTPAVSSANPSGQHGSTQNSGFSSYEELFSAIEAASFSSSDSRGDSAFDEAVPMESSAPTASESAPMEPSAPDFSGTNVQVAGIDEADIVKTDGSHIYVLTGDKLTIVAVDGGDMEVVSRIPCVDQEKEAYACEMYVKEGRLIVLYDQNYQNISPTGRDTYEPRTLVEIYDVTDPAQPKKLNTLGQSGSYHSSRMVDDILYVVSSYGLFSPMDCRDMATYVPTLLSQESSRFMAPGDISLIEEAENASYVVVTSIDTKDARAHDSAKAVFGYAGTLYANDHSLIVAADQSQSQIQDIQPDSLGRHVQTMTYQNNTQLVLFSLEDGAITQKTTATIPGSLVDQFAIDEYAGYFRFVTTQHEYVERVYTDGVDTYEYEDNTTNGLYVLDENLRPVSQIENLALDEQVYSVRFMGDTAYFVTFRQVDPLFSVDLSDPTQPRILGQLKIPGFSDYLQSYGSSLLFGFGQEVDEETGEIKGLKLSMFDVSHPSDVREVAKHVLNDAYWSEATDNHKAILVSPEKNLIAFQAEDSYYVFCYDPQDGFQQQAKIPLDEDREIEYYTYYYESRGLYIDDTFYLVEPSQVRAYALDDFTLFGSLSFSQEN